MRPLECCPCFPGSRPWVVSFLRPSALHWTKFWGSRAGVGGFRKQLCSSSLRVWLRQLITITRSALPRRPSSFAVQRSTVSTFVWNTIKHRSMPSLGSIFSKDLWQAWPPIVKPTTSALCDITRPRRNTGLAGLAASCSFYNFFPVLWPNAVHNAAAGVQGAVRGARMGGVHGEVQGTGAQRYFCYVHGSYAEACAKVQGGSGQ